jgi:hypothetical protein
VLKKESWTHITLRQAVVRWLRANPEVKLPSGKMSYLEGFLSEQYKSWEEFLTTMAKIGTWGEQITIQTNVPAPQS